jgi:hypothetical protein
LQAVLAAVAVLMVHTAVHAAAVVVLVVIELHQVLQYQAVAQSQSQSVQAVQAVVVTP